MKLLAAIAGLTLLCTSVMAETPRASLSGRVLDAAGKPLANTTVLVYHAGEKVGYSTTCPSCYRDCGKHVVTNEQGVFQIDNLASELWFTLLAVRKGYVPSLSDKLDSSKNGVGEKIVLSPRKTSREKASIASGRVVTSTGAPVRNALVTPIGLMHGDSSTYGFVPGLEPLAVTDDHGDFDIFYEGASPAMLVEVEGRGYAPLFARVNTNASRAKLAVGEGATVRGKLLFEGKPVGNAEVGLIAKERGGYGGELKIIGHPYEEQRVGTGSDGSFVLSNVPEPVTWRLYGKMSTLPQGVATAPVEVTTKAEGQFLDAVRLQGTRAHSITGKVTLSDGGPMPSGMRLTLGKDEIWDWETVNLDPDGSFTFTNVPDGTFCLSAAVRGYKAPEPLERYGFSLPFVEQTPAFLLFSSPVGGEQAPPVSPA